MRFTTKIFIALGIVTVSGAGVLGGSIYGVQLLNDKIEQSSGSQTGFQEIKVTKDDLVEAQPDEWTINALWLFNKLYNTESFRNETESWDYDVWSDKSEIAKEYDETITMLKFKKEIVATQTRIVMEVELTTPEALTFVFAIKN